MSTYKIVLFSVLFFFATVCSAQKKKPKKTKEQKSIEMTNELNKEVKLTKAQHEKIKSINLDYLTEKEAIENRLDELKKAKKNKINAILTDEQKKKREALKKKKKK